MSLLVPSSLLLAPPPHPLLHASSSLAQHASSPLPQHASAALLDPRSQPRVMMRAPARNPNNLPTKVCVVCNRPFTWRKKWERCWDEVTTCSKRCNAERKKMKLSKTECESDASANSDATPEAQTRRGIEGDVDSTENAKARRKEARKAAKATKRAVREGRADPTVGQKNCDLCQRSANTLVRCQVDSTAQWKLVCGRCWKTDQVAGGVVDGSGSNVHYRYGGLWKNLKQ